MPAAPQCKDPEDQQPAKPRGSVTWKGYWKSDDPRYKERFSVVTGWVSAPPRKKLVLAVHPANGGLVIAAEARARFVDQIRRALDSSATWKDLQAALPPGEYDRIAEAVAECEDERPRLDQPFDACEVPGVSEGDYPPWLQPEMESILPDEVLRKFGRVESTMLNGSYVHIDPAQRAELTRELERQGFVVIESSDLKFY